MHMEKVILTVDLAKKYWDRRDPMHRPVKQKHVANLVAAVARKEWVCNGETIKFNGDGTMKDGHHRTQVVIQGGIPIETWVAHDIPSDAVFTLDGQAKRSLADALSMKGEKNAKHLAGVLSSTHKWLEDGWVKSSSTPKSVPTVTQGLALLDRFPLAREAARAGARFGHRAHQAGAGWWYLVASVIDKSACEEFMHAVISGENICKGHPAYAFRDRTDTIIRLRARGDRPHPHMTTALLVKAWNIHLSGGSCVGLRWAVGSGEQFPSMGDIAELADIVEGAQGEQ